MSGQRAESPVPLLGRDLGAIAEWQWRYRSLPEQAIGEGERISDQTGPGREAEWQASRSGELCQNHPGWSSRSGGSQVQSGRTRTGEGRQAERDKMSASSEVSTVAPDAPDTRTR